MRAAMQDRRPQLPELGLAWKLAGGATINDGVALLPEVGSYAWSPLIDVRAFNNAVLSGEVFIPSGEVDTLHVTSSYFLSDRATPANNQSGNTGNGSSRRATPGQWGSFESATWPLGNEVVWAMFYVRISTTIGVPGTRYRNLRLTLTR